MAAMTTRRSLLLGGAALAATGVLGGCGRRFPNYRYRLKVEIEAPGGLRTGSTVIEVQTKEAGEYSLAPSSVGHRLRGQAAIIELPGNQRLYALLSSQDQIDWAATVFFRMTPDVTGKDAFARRMALLYKQRQEMALPRRFVYETANLTLDGYPLFVRFRDERDPTTIEQVDPDNLEATYGPGFNLKRITVQLTDEPFSTGIEKRLTWLETQKGGLIKTKFETKAEDRPFGAWIHAGYFQRK